MVESVLASSGGSETRSMRRARVRRKEVTMNATPRATQPVQDFFDMAREVAVRPQEFFARLPRRGAFAGPRLRQKSAPCWWKGARSGSVAALSTA
jgi:hypothetical protein